MQNVISSMMMSTWLVLRQRNYELCDEPRKPQRNSNPGGMSTCDIIEETISSRFPMRVDRRCDTGE